MQSIHTIQTVNGSTLSIPIPAELQGKRVEIVITPVEQSEEPSELEKLARQHGMLGKKPELSAEMQRRLVESPDLLKGSVLRYDDPFGPACPVEDWEALS